MRRYGMLWIAHGSRDPQWVATLDEAWASVRGQWDGPAFLSFLELVEGRLIQDGIDALEAEGVTDIITVPVFVSSGSTHTEEIAWSLGIIPVPYEETEMEPMRVQATVHWCGPMDDAEELSAILSDRVRGLSQHPEEEHLVLAAHGSVVPLFRRTWEQQLHRLGMIICQSTGIPAYNLATIMPETITSTVVACNRSFPEKRVIVVPVFLSPGYYTNKKIPGLLQETQSVYAKETLLPDSRVARWAIRVALQRRQREETIDGQTGKTDL